MKNFQLLFPAVIGLLILLFSSGCSHALGAVPSTTPLGNSSEYTVIGTTSGSSTSCSILFIPIGTNTPMRDALQSALKKKKADALIDVQADYFVFNCLYIFGIYTTEVRGKAIKINNISDGD